LTYIGRRFGLSQVSGIGVCCGTDGLFVGAIPLLKKVCGTEASGRPEMRPVPDINRDLSMCFGVPVEFDRKLMVCGGLPKRSAAATSCTLKSQRCTCKFPIRQRCQDQNKPPAKSLKWLASCRRASSSRPIGIPRNTRGGRPEAQAGSAGNLLLQAPRPTIRRTPRKMPRSYRRR